MSLNPYSSNPPESLEEGGVSAEADSNVSNPYLVPELSPVMSLMNVQPRVLTVVGVLVVCLISYFASSIFALVLAMGAYMLTHGNVERTPEMMEKVWSSKIGFPLLVLVPQIGLALPVVAAAILAPAGFRRRLKLQQGSWPVPLWITGALATPLIGFISASIFQVFVGESENLEQLSKVMRELTAGGFLIPMALMIGLAPALCEELVFRGYLQTRLTARYGSMVGLVIASAVFAAFHMDLVHSLSVFPLGLWLGWLCLRSGSLYPAMIAHFYNNAFSVIASSFAPEKPDGPVSLEGVVVLAGAMGCGLIGIVITVVGSHLVRIRQSSHPFE